MSKSLKTKKSEEINHPEQELRMCTINNLTEVGGGQGQYWIFKKKEAI